MKLHNLLALVLLGLAGQACAMQKPKALEEKKAMAAVAEGAGDTKQSVALAETKKELSWLQVLQADATLNRAVIPPALRTLIADYLEVDQVKYLPAVFTTRHIDLGQFFYPLACVSLPDRRIALLGNDSRGKEIDRGLVFVDSKQQNLEGNKVYSVNVWPAGTRVHFSSCPLGVTPDGKHLVIAARRGDFAMRYGDMLEIQNRQTFDSTYEICLWDLTTNTMANIVSHKKLQALLGLEFGGVLAVLSNGYVALRDKKDAGAIVLYNPVNNQIVGRLLGHTAQIRIIKLVNPTTVVTGTAEGDILVWDITDVRKPTHIVHKEVIDKDHPRWLDQDLVDVIAHGHLLYLCQMYTGEYIKIADSSHKYPVEVIESKFLLNAPFGSRLTLHMFDAAAAQELQNLSLRELEALEKLISICHRSAMRLKPVGRVLDRVGLWRMLPSAIQTNMKNYYPSCC